MIRPWREIADFYDRYGDERPSMRALGVLARQINNGVLASGLFAWTSMNDLCVVQTKATYPYYGPVLRLSPVGVDEVELRYEDSDDRTKQWHRIVAADQAFTRLVKFLDELRWFPSAVLKTMHTE